MSKERKSNIPEIDKKVLQQMELKRMEIITLISDLPQSTKETLLKNLDELIILEINPFRGAS